MVTYTESKPRKRNILLFTWVMMAMVIASLMGMLHVIVEQVNKNNESKITIDKMSSAIHQLEEKLQTVSNRVHSFAQDAEMFASLKAQLIEHQKLIKESLHTSDNTWHLKEAEYYIRLSIEHLQINKNPQNAAFLLESAETCLKEMQDFKVMPLQTTLIHNKERLLSVPVPDIEAIWVSIQQIVPLIKALPLKHLQSNQPLSLPTQPIVVESTWYKNLLQNILQLQTLVKIRNHAQPIAPLLDEEQQAYVQARLQLLLEQVKYNAVLKNAKMYEWGLQEIIDIIKDDFDLETEAVNNTITRIESLKMIKLQPLLPDIIDSLLHVEQQLAALK